MQKKNIIIGVILFVILIAAAATAYNVLSKKYRPDNILPVNEKRGSQENGEGDLESEEQDQINASEKMKAADFTVYDMDGNAIKLSEMFGKPIVVNFWASWCSPCKSEMPEFEKFWNEMGEEVTFIMVNMTDGARETKETASGFIEENGYTFPIYYDTDYEAATAYGITALPTTLFIDAQGYVVTGVVSSLDEESLRTAISMIQE